VGAPVEETLPPPRATIGDATRLAFDVRIAATPGCTGTTPTSSWEASCT